MAVGATVTFHAHFTPALAGPITNLLAKVAWAAAGCGGPGPAVLTKAARKEGKGGGALLTGQDIDFAYPLRMFAMGLRTQTDLRTCFPT